MEKGAKRCLIDFAPLLTDSLIARQEYWQQTFGTVVSVLKYPNLVTSALIFLVLTAAPNASDAEQHVSPQT